MHADRQRRRGLTAVLLFFALCLCSSGVSRADPVAELRAMLGGRAAKIVLVDRQGSGAMHLFDVATAEMKRIGEDLACESPLLSPDGTRVVYQRAGKVNIRALDGGERTEVIAGSEGHWWIDPADGKEWLYYSTNTMEKKLRWPDNEGIETHRIRLEDKTDEWVVNWKAGGGPSADGTHVGSGYASVLIFDLVNDEVHELYKGGQGCNPSMSPDNSYVIMYLDLPHETFSIRDKNDELIWQLHHPEGTTEWQQPEWSTDGDFATATAKESNGLYSVYVIQLSTQKTVRVVEAGTTYDWAHPHMWIESSVRDVPPLPAPPTPSSDTASGAADAGTAPSTDAGTSSGGGDSGCAVSGSPLTPAAALLAVLLLFGALARRRED